MKEASSCGGINAIPGISFFTATASILLTIGTTTFHGIILWSIYKLRAQKLDIFFYKLLLNISISDLLSGILTDPYSTIFHIQEGLLVKPLEIKVIHVMLYLFGSVPLATLVLLCVDRILALLMALSYRKGPKDRTAWYLVALTWLLSACQTAAYFQLGFISYLMIFAGINIAGASFALISTTIIFHKKVPRGNLRSVVIHGAAEQMQANDQASDDRHRVKQYLRPSKRENNATKAFQIISIVNVVSYLPTCFATAYMNACVDCNCAIVHSMRDIAIVSILAGPLFRAVTFLLCLRPLRPAFFRRNQEDQEMSGP